jgi:ketosteroid isomerase-like protein
VSNDIADRPICPENLKTNQKRRTQLMKRALPCCLIAFVLLSSAVSLAQKAGEVEKAVAALEQQWLQSQKTNNPDLVAPLIADKFVGTGPDGKVSGKAELLAEAKATKYSSMEYEDVKVAVFGDTAIATGSSKSKGTDASGKPMDDHVRWTDTWVKMPGGKWQCVASHVSPIKM